jgi:hypothetical protein
VHWGVIRKGGRRTGSAGVVVFVHCKCPRELVSVRRRLPRSITIRVRNVRRVVRIDVQGIGFAGVLLNGLARPGAAVRLALGAGAQPPTGTLSALVQDGQLLRAVLSGHVALQTGKTVTGITVSGQSVALNTVARVIRNSGVDAAWSTPGLFPQAALSMAPRAVRDPVKTDVLHSATMLVPWDVAGRVVQIDDVDARATFGQGAGQVTMRGLCAVHPSTSNPGDSGSPVLDDSGVLIGFVVGSSGDKTFLVPARRVLNALATP